MRMQRYDSLGEVEGMMLRTIPEQDFKKPASIRQDVDAVMFNVGFTADGASVGIESNGQYIVLPTTLEVGATYIVYGDNYEVRKLADVDKFLATCKAIKAANTFKDYSAQAEPLWYEVNNIYLSDLKGKFDPEVVKDLLDGHKERVARLSKAAKAKAAAEQAAKKAEETEWYEHPTASFTDDDGCQINVDHGTITIANMDESFTITLDDNVRVSTYMAKDYIFGYQRLNGSLAAIMNYLVAHKADFEVQWESKDGKLSRTAHMQNKLEYPMVDNCVSKSRRPTYLAMKKLKGGCNGVQLMSYEKMSGVKARLLEVSQIAVSIERPDQKWYEVKVPVSLTVNARDYRIVDVKLGADIEGMMSYIDLKCYLAKGLKMRKQISADSFIDIMQSLGKTREQSYEELRKRWQVEAL